MHIIPLQITTLNSHYNIIKKKITIQEKAETFRAACYC